VVAEWENELDKDKLKKVMYEEVEPESVKISS
jgi:hypothetical protein